MSTVNNRLTELELDQIVARYQSGRPGDILRLIDHVAAQDEILDKLRAEIATLKHEKNDLQFALDCIEDNDGCQ